MAIRTYETPLNGPFSPFFQPGAKSLLLHSVIEQYSDGTAPAPSKKADTTESTAIPKVSKKPTASLKGKRKDMSMVMRTMIEKEQSNVISMYKQMKKTQRQQENLAKLESKTK